MHHSPPIAAQAAVVEVARHGREMLLSISRASVSNCPLLVSQLLQRPLRKMSPPSPLARLSALGVGRLQMTVPLGRSRWSSPAVPSAVLFSCFVR